MINLKEIYKLPNLISLSRILILPLFIYFITPEESLAGSLAVFCFIVLTDVLDGFISRRFNLVTALGKVLDPIADKIVTFCVIGMLVLYKGFPLWFFLTIIARDIILTIGGWWLYHKHSTVVYANIWGKISTVSLAFLSTWYIVIDYLNLQSNLPLAITFTAFFVATASYISSFYKSIRH